MKFVAFRRKRIEYSEDMVKVFPNTRIILSRQNNNGFQHQQDIEAALLAFITESIRIDIPIAPFYGKR